MTRSGLLVAVGVAAGLLAAGAAVALARPGVLGELAAFWSAVRVGAAEREAELRDALGLDGRHDQVDAHTLGGSQ